ncbi:mannose-1-phosphate guanylyltransferase [Prosthecobacter debontii]|uniref:Mannose-1-phosphate guanylyltransferase n=2 Tax=Prosthecobacter debontii TaxID=48467 RepID=A0A1T4YBY2_9BACT|nr:mannose-1-phosphate guanylyltransferase [Prosthecobacter debontii]
MQVGIKDFVVNTHHIPEAYAQAFPAGSYRGAAISFRNESPVRLETAGGIANVRDLLNEEPFIVYNGDILTDLPLDSLLKEHREKENLVTLVLRSFGPALHISYDVETGLVTDIRNKLGTGREGEYLFTGIYACQPEIHRWLTPGKVESVIPIFLRMIQEGARLGAVVVDDGQWWDLGSRAAYLAAHQALHEQGKATASAIHASAQVSPQAELRGLNVIGEGAVVEAGAALEDCILWPGATVAADAVLRQCIIRSGIRAEGVQMSTDM